MSIPRYLCVAPAVAAGFGPSRPFLERCWIGPATGTTSVRRRAPFCTSGVSGNLPPTYLPAQLPILPGSRLTRSDRHPLGTAGSAEPTAGFASRLPVPGRLFLARLWRARPACSADSGQGSALQIRVFVTGDIPRARAMTRAGRERQPRVPAGAARHGFWFCGGRYSHRLGSAPLRSVSLRN